jgi:hypothetical protein
MAIKYAKKAKTGVSVGGIFWFGKSQDNYENSFSSFQEVSDHHHLSGKFCLGFSNIMDGKLFMEKVFNSGDRFWTYVYASYLEYGLNGFEKNAARARDL